MLDKELWKDIEGYEGLYQVSNMGRVRSSSFKGKKRKQYLILKQCICSSGYFVVSLFKHPQKSTQNVHRLVAQAFISNPQKLPCVNHIDGNKLNNNWNNLEWVSYSENTQHAYDTNLAYSPKGSHAPCSKLTVEEVRQIRAEYIRRSRMHGSGALAQKYHISVRAINNIVNHKTYKDVK